LFSVKNIFGIEKVPVFMDIIKRKAFKLMGKEKFKALKQLNAS